MQEIGAFKAMLVALTKKPQVVAQGFTRAAHRVTVFSRTAILRQAAGPLTENLPNVLTGDPCRVDLSLQSPSPRGLQRRLSSRSITPAHGVNTVIVFSIELVMARFEGQRGHLAEAAKS